ncbi:glutamate-1-semialdehyde 2,1-aminomutase [Pseudobdellovibrio exovorus]|uniref:glutamate-1-semialdehyde 2,1-aminomutase n=1 Tax=Pseudobdellovibrio exovorus TaxID=453816 RepID=UPI00190F1401|nr:glutamate-1-semialdehyde 2,1-aminomutase [Pseudobdellovibrio exovorus]
MEKKVNSKEYFERSKKVAPGGVHSPVRSFAGMGREPVFFKSAQGPYLWSVEGKKYIDFCQSFGPLVLGHRDAEVEAEVREMIGTAWSFGACEPYSLELAEWITSRIPWVEKLRFVSSGTEAVMSALRVARAVTGKEKILKFEGCYHGHADSLLVKAGSGLAGIAASSSAGISARMAESTVVCPLDDETLLEEVFTLHGKDLAAVIIEPLPANYGLLIQRKEFLQKVADLAKQHQVLLIFDEVISGFRMALGGMAQILGIQPDLVTYGKVIGGGFPVGCYGGKKEYMDLVAPNGPVYQAGTLSANPVGMRAGLRTLQKMEREQGWTQLDKKGEFFEKQLTDAMAEKNLQFIRQGSLFWFHQKTETPLRRVDQIPATQKESFNKVFLQGLERGVYLAPNAYEVGFLSLAHTDEILTEAATILTDVIKGL